MSPKRKDDDMSDRASVWDPRCPWASIAHALQYWEDVPEVVSVPDDPPAASFSVDGAVVEIRRADDVLGVVCWGYQEVDPDIKAIWLARARRGEA